MLLKQSVRYSMRLFPVVLWKLQWLIPTRWGGTLVKRCSYLTFPQVQYAPSGCGVVAYL